MMKLVSVAVMRAIEAEADSLGVTYAAMMERAGKGVADVVRECYSHLENKTVVGLVGGGSNGGDALVTLADLAHTGWRVRAYLVRARPDDALVRRLEERGETLNAAQDPTGEKLDAWLSESSVLLDGVLGTGARLPLSAELAALFCRVRQRAGGLRVVAVDCPSGVDCESGEMADETLPAEITVCMEAIKNGLVRFPAFERVGKLRVVALGLPPGLETLIPIRRQVASPAWVRGVLPPRQMTAHKGTFGTAFIVAGSVNYTGAALLAGQAAYRVGTGLVRLAVPAPLHAALAGQAAEVTWLTLPHENGWIAAGAAEVIQHNLDRVTAMLIGPGLGVEETTAEFFRKLLSGVIKRPSRHRSGSKTSFAGEPGAQRSSLPPLVIDADGLNLLRRVPDWKNLLGATAVLTPHPGEMAALTGRSVAEIEASRWETAQQTAAEWGHVVALKGALTVVAAPDGRMGVIPVATPALARAGTGDVLAGMIVGLRAQGVPPFEAALAGAFLHGRAGMLAEQRVGHAAAVLAGDVLAALPETLRLIASTDD